MITRVRWQCSQNISRVSKGKGLMGLNGGRGRKFEGGFYGKVGSCGGNGGREGGVENKSVMGSKFMASGEEGLDGWVGADGGKVKGGSVVFRVSRILLSAIPRDIMGKAVVKHLDLIEEPIDNRWVVREDDKKGTLVEVNGDLVLSVASASAECLIPPKTAKQRLARKNELKAKRTLMLAVTDEHLLKFHACKDAKSLWEAIKNSQKGLDKTYDRFQKLTSQFEIHGEVISQEDANLKLLRSLPSAWNNIALIMRNRSDLDTLSMDDFYNNLKVYESDIKSQSSSSLNSQNVAFVSSDNSSSTNETVNIAHSLDNEYLKQIDTDDLEEINLKWQVEMLTMRVKRFTKKTRRKLDLNGKETGNRNRDALTRNTPVDTSTTNSLVIQDEIGGYDWSFQAKEELIIFALMAYKSQGLSSSSSSDSEGNRMFPPVSAAGFTYVNLDGSILINAATLPNADLPINPLMPDLKDTTDLQDTRIFSGAYDDEVKGAEPDFNNLELTIISKPKNMNQPLIYPSWIEAMQDELLQFRLQKVWRLVDLSKGKHAIETKWVYRNKKDERGKKKQDCLHKMDVKSAFLYGTIEKEMYVCQPRSFEDPHFPDKVYKVEKALYGLHQAPRAWYKTLSTYLLENGFRRGIIDKTLFIKKDKGLMHKKFQMSSIGELAFFLGFQFMQRDDGIFISQDKDLPFDLEVFLDSDYAGASLDRKSTTRVEDIDKHNAIFVISSHIKKVSANIKREGKDFSWKVTPLFASMTVQAPEDMGEEDMFGVNDLDGDEVFVDVLASEKVEESVKVIENEVSTADAVTTAGEVVTTAEIKASKPKAITTTATTVTVAGTRPKEKGIVIQEPSKKPLPKQMISSQKPSQAKDKGKEKMVEPEKPLKRNDQIMIDEEFAKNLEA
uniref:Reverse transcriptase Ty1/copia-type domain-containing protein n=1 Tax=Tanacetum cinerariifolium TaxID=118510 RepID=A0A6L2L1J3_TANCI|nr:hypothetical protein [Tanacetum cinerariifolium]